MNEGGAVEITQEQRNWARVAGIMVFANYVLQGLGDYPTIIARMGETFAERATWAAASQRLYSLALLEVTSAWIAIGVFAFAWYIVLAPINRRLAQLALILRLGASFVGGAAMMLRVMEARLYGAWTTDGLFTAEQLQTLVLAARRSAGAGIQTAWMFQGLGSVLFFVLLWRSRYVPRAVAAVGAVGSGVVFVMAAAMFVFPERINELKLAGLPALFADVVMALCFLIKGLPKARAAAPAGSPS
jgi:hypothetical protein